MKRKFINLRLFRICLGAAVPIGMGILAMAPVTAGATKTRNPVHLAGEQAPDRNIRGRIISDTEGSGLPGVSILLKGTQTGTTTDAAGNFTLRIGDGADQVLVISYIGYEGGDGRQPGYTGYYHGGKR